MTNASWSHSHSLCSEGNHDHPTYSESDPKLISSIDSQRTRGYETPYPHDKAHSYHQQKSSIARFCRSLISIDPTVAYQPFNEIPPGNMAFEPKCQPTEGSNSLMARQADFAEKSPERSYRPNDHILSLLHRNKSSRRSLQNFLSDRSSYSRPENPPFSTTVHTLAWRFLPIFQQTAFKYLRRNETYVLLHPNSICS